MDDLKSEFNEHILKTAKNPGFVEPRYPGGGVPGMRDLRDIDNIGFYLTGIRPVRCPSKGCPNPLVLPQNNSG